MCNLSRVKSICGESRFRENPPQRLSNGLNRYKVRIDRYTCEAEQSLHWSKDFSRMRHRKKMNRTVRSNCWSPVAELETDPHSCFQRTTVSKGRQETYHSPCDILPQPYLALPALWTLKLQEVIYSLHFFYFQRFCDQICQSVLGKDPEPQVAPDG